MEAVETCTYQLRQVLFVGCGWRRLCKAVEKLLWGRAVVEAVIIGRDGMGWDGDQEPAVAALVPSLGCV